MREGVGFAAMRIPAILLALFLAACGGPPARVEQAKPLPRMDDNASLAAAESAFAAHSVREDMRVAFLAAFAPDGVFVRNAWVNAIDWLRDRPAPPIVLDWHSQYVEVAASGELGLSTGPWTITSKAKPETPPAHGQFVSVWRREGAGPWKVAVDLGISHSSSDLWTASLETRQPARGTSAAGPGIAEAEARFAAEARDRGLRAAYAAHGAENLRFYRSGSAPWLGKAVALASPAMAEEAGTWTIERSETARSGDFGYARGAYSPRATPGNPVGWYLRVWRREGSAWRIVMDVVTPKQ
jgi:ketosteroid isomerase-like protein